MGVTAPPRPPASPRGDRDAARPASGAAPVGADASDPTPALTPAEETTAEPAGRHTLAVLCPAVAVGGLAGGIFSGPVGPRIVGVLAAGLGCGLAYGLQRLRSSTAVLGGMAAGVLGIGVLMAMLTGGPAVLGHLTSSVTGALSQARLLRPPIEMTDGFAAVLGWIMAAVGVAAAWTATVLKRPSIGMILPLVVAGVAAISLPDDAKLPSGIALLVMFGLGLGVLSGDRRGTGADRVPLAFELRRGARALPLLAVVCAALVGLGRAGFLFPTPVISPQLEAQKPKTVPISDVPDRVLFTVRSTLTGPWVVGVLDVYDGTDWRLPPVDEAQLRDVPRSGVVDPALQPGEQATFTIHGLDGAVLPTLPNTVGIQATGPRLDYDARSGNIRLVEGTVSDGFTYRVAAAASPTPADAAGDTAVPAADIVSRYAAIPAPPPSVTKLLSQAPTTSRWATFDFLRTWVLDNVTASGAGSPVSIPVSRVEQILGHDKEASPFEIVALQALLGRWAGLPTRIAYGFDGGDRSGDALDVHPRNGASFPEVYLEGHGWVPVIGVPKHAKQSAGSDPRFQQVNKDVTPSDDIAVPLFLPVQTPASTQVYETVRTVVLLALIVATLVAAALLGTPALRKAVIRQRRRAAARRSGPRARVVEAYAEWRDRLADFGYDDGGDTPLMLLRRFAPDDEHTQLAWLVTRVIWGDMQQGVSEAVAGDAEELSRTLQRRLAQAHPLTVRLVAALSRRSLHGGFAIDLPTAAEAPR